MNDSKINKKQMATTMDSLRGIGNPENMFDHDNDIINDIVPVNDKGFRKLTSGLGKKIKEKKEETKHAVSFFKEEIKEKKLVETINQLARRTPDRKTPDKNTPERSLENVCVNDVDEDSFDEDEDIPDNEKSESRFGKLRHGIGRKFKGIREEFVDIRDESLHSFNEFREVYQEKAEQKKAILTSFTEEEITILRKNSPLHSKMTKQMNTMYMSRRLSIIRVSLLSARNLNLDLVKKTSSDMLYVKLSLGLERAKSKLVMAKQNPVWKEVVDLSRHSQDEDTLRLDVLARGSKETAVIGEARLDLRQFPSDTANMIWVKLGNGQSGELNLQVNVTATNNGNYTATINKKRTPSTTSASANIESYATLASMEASNDNGWNDIEPIIDDKMDQDIVEEMMEAPSSGCGAATIISENTPCELKTAPTVGSCTIRIIQASGLGSSKIQGAWTPSPYLVLEVDNTYHRTVTILKERNPRWDKEFQVTIRDAFSSLHMSLYSEKPKQGHVFLGRVVIPLNKLRSTCPQWIMLKDANLRKQAKGDEPKLQLEIDCTIKKFRSAINAFGNKEELLIDPPKQKFERTVLLANYNRIKRFIPKGSRIRQLNEEYTKILAWESPVSTVKAFIFYMLFIYYFELWWVPVYILYHLVKTYIVQWYTGETNHHNKHAQKTEFVSKDSLKRNKSKDDIVVRDSMEDFVDEDESEDESAEGKKSLKKSLDQLQNVLQEIQTGSGMVASSLEKVSNMFNLGSPFLTFLFGGMLAAAAGVLWVFGFRNVLLLWGINKFTKKLRDPNPVPTNEVANLILRVPDFEEVEDAKQIPIRENVNIV